MRITVKNAALIFKRCFMLPKNLRLTKRGSFTYVYNKGERRSAGLIFLIFVKSTSLKIGFSVSNKIGNAVLRNKVKRRLRSICREVHTLLRPAQIVLSVKTGVEKLSYSDMRDIVRRLFANASLFK